MEKKGALNRIHIQYKPLGDDELRLKVAHVGLCHTDVFKIDGGWDFNIAWPLVPGHEIVGYVDKIGSKVTKFKPGEAVCFGVYRDCCH